jgi:hypothetical protein
MEGEAEKLVIQSAAVRQVALFAERLEGRVSL